MLKISLCGMDLNNQVIAASGTFGFGQEYSQLFDVSRLGAICTKGLTLEKRYGNKGIRVVETRGGIMNSVGLQNPGVRGFIENELPQMERFNIPIITNLGGASLEDYIEGVELLNSTSVDMVELNISCPNVKAGGMALGIKSNIAYEAVSEVRKACRKPLMVKLSPNAEDIVDMAQKCCQAGADALSLVNTFKAMAIDIYRRKPVFENVTAGLSGPAIKPIALRMVYEVCGAVDVPVVGVGGIATAQDALEFIMAGASAVQVGTASFMNPMACIDIIEGMQSFMEQQGIKNIGEIRNTIRR